MHLSIDESLTLMILDDAQGHQFRMEIDNALLDEVRVADAQSTARDDYFSRACRGCGTSSPRKRSVSTSCGRIVCRKCAGKTDSCPVCATECGFVELIENRQRSRKCGVCMYEEPLQRVLLSTCGHTICCHCALQMIQNAEDTASDFIPCPFCQYPSRFVFLAEDVIKMTCYQRVCRYIKRVLRKIFC